MVSAPVCVGVPVSTRVVASNVRPRGSAGVRPRRYVTVSLPPTAAGNVTRKAVSTVGRCGATVAVNAKPPPSTVQLQFPMTVDERSRLTSTGVPALRMLPPFRVSALPTTSIPSGSTSERCTT